MLTFRIAYLANGTVHCLHHLPLALWPSLPVNCYSDDEGANDRDDPARRQSASSRGSNGQALTGDFRAAAKANAYRYADITAARKQAKFHASHWCHALDFRLSIIRPYRNREKSRRAESREALRQRGRAPTAASKRGKVHATEDRAAFFSRRRRRHQILRCVSGPTTGAGGKVAAGALSSTASGASS